MDRGPCLHGCEPAAELHPRELHTVPGDYLQPSFSPTGAPSTAEANHTSPGDTRSMGRWGDRLVGTVLQLQLSAEAYALVKYLHLDAEISRDPRMLC